LKVLTENLIVQYSSVLDTLQAN